MDYSHFVKKCQKHLNQNINFLQIFPESADYKLACQRCLTVIQEKSYIYDILEILNQESDMLNSWPLSQSEKYFEEMLQILNNLDDKEYLKQVFQKIKDLRTKFDDQISKIEEKLLECSPKKIKEEFDLKYKQAAQMEQLVEFIKEELDQQNQQENIKQKFKQFIKQQIENNEILNLLKYLKENQQKQEINLNKLTQITESIQNIFQDPELFKEKKDQAIMCNLEQNELQIKVESLLIQLEEGEEKNQQEQILKSEEIKKLTQKINNLTSYFNVNLMSSKLFQQKCETLTQNLKQKEEDLNKKIQKQDNEIKIYEIYFTNAKNKQYLQHIHGLNLQKFEQNTYCDICKQTNLKVLWYCRQCNYGVCQFCIHKEEQEIFKTAQLYQQYQKNEQILLNSVKQEAINQFSKQCETLTQNFKQKEEDLNKTILKQANEIKIYEKYFRNGKSKQSLLHTHELTLSKVKYGTAFCNECNQTGLEITWYCSQCNFYICQTCIHKDEQKIINKVRSYQKYKCNGQVLLAFMKKQAKYLPQHEHQLNLVSASNSTCTFCNVCQDQDILFSWYCQPCDFDVCLSCSGLKKKFANHEHILILVKPRSLLKGAIKCSNCNLKLSYLCWHCYQCKYNLCLDCSSKAL